jgi:hypothetical protein
MIKRENVFVFSTSADRNEFDELDNAVSRFEHCKIAIAVGSTK